MIKMILPLVLVVIDVVQAVICLYTKDYARACYWASAGVLTISTIYMK